MRILVVEDNPWAAKLLVTGLTELGYAVDTVSSGREGEELATVEHFDIVLLDLMLPDRDGIDICKTLRRRGIETPILVLTGLNRAERAALCLDAGADDFMSKPYDFEELAARMRALLRRAESHESSQLSYRDIEMDLLKREVRRGDELITLTVKEFALLEYLLRNTDRVVTRTQIAQSVWDTAYSPNSNVVDVHVSSLRRKVELDSRPRVIHTVIGAGYRLGEPG